MTGRIPECVTNARLRAMYTAMANTHDLARLWELLAAAKRELSSSDWERLKDIDFLSGTSFTHDDVDDVETKEDLPPI